MNRKISVLLVEDECIVSEAIAALLEMEEGITLVGVADSAEMCLRRARILHPDVILLDLHLPDQSGAEVIGRLLAADPATRIVILTGYASDEDLALALRAGAVGCVFKTQAHGALVQAIVNAQQGRASVPPQIAKLLLQMINPPKRTPAAKVAKLSKAEQHILTHIAQGLENKEIARRLCVSRPTVHAHVSHILSKLQLENRTQAAVFAVKHGLVSLATPRQSAASVLPFERPSSSATYAGD